MKRVLTLALSMMAAMLGGCAAEPIKANEVLFSNPNTIKVQWDEILSSEKEARVIAQAHCGSRELELVDASSDAALFGLVKSKTWRCVEPAGNSSAK